MSALSDLQAAVTSLTNGVASLTTAVGQAVTLLQQISSGNTVSQTDAENAVTAINQAMQNLATETADLTAAEAPPPASP